MGDMSPNERKKKIKKTGLPRHVKDMSKEQLEAILKKKSECNAKALQVVELMIESSIDVEWFLEQLKFIDASHFQDITEERALSKICGYPLCPECLKTSPSQQYRISTKYNKVYDITERKNFCSNECYKSSKFVKDQLLTSPLWLRDKEEIPIFKLLPSGSQGSGVGEEIDLGHINCIKSEVKKLNNEDKFMSVADYTKDSIKQLSKRVSDIEIKGKNKSETQNPIVQPCTSGVEDNFLKSKNLSPEGKQENDTSIHKDKLTRHIEVVNSQELGNVTFSSKVRENHVKTSQYSEITKNVKLNDEIQNEKGSESQSLNEGKREGTSMPRKEEPKQQKKIAKTETYCPEVTSSVIHIEKCLHEWFTIESMCYLLGEDKVKDLVSDKGDCIKEYYKAVGKSFWDPVTQERYEALCRKLNLMEIQEQQYCREERDLKPLPDYSILKDESLKMNLKIQAFYEGNLNIPIPARREEVSNTPECPPSCVLPLVDVHAQSALRRRIILDNLKRVLPDLLRTFGLTSRDISTDVRNLISTFTLSANNITFMPTEWNLLGLILIKMLSVRDTKLKMLLETQQGVKYQTMLLMAFQQDGGYLERLMYWLTDLDNIMKKKV